MLLKAVREEIGEDMPMAITISSQLYDQRSANLSHTEDEMIEFLKRAQQPKYCSRKPIQLTKKISVPIPCRKAG